MSKPWVAKISWRGQRWRHLTPIGIELMQAVPSIYCPPGGGVWLVKVGTMGDHCFLEQVLLRFELYRYAISPWEFVMWVGPRRFSVALPRWLTA